MAKSSTDSSSIFEFINQNFGVLLLITLFFIAGFMGGSLWKENKLLKNDMAENGPVEPNPNQQEPAANQGWTQEKLVEIAADLDLNQAEFTQCLKEDRYAEAINEETQGGQAVGVSGTPGSILVVDGQAKKFISGAVPIQQLTATIDSFIENPDQEAEVTEIFNPEAFVALSDEDHYRGNREAQIIIVEYSDYECPYCGRFHDTMKQVLDEYEDQVAWVYRHYPLPQLHPTAPMLANASECAAEIGGNDGFWALSDRLLAE